MYLPYFVFITTSDNFGTPENWNAIAAIAGSFIALCALVVSVVTVWFSSQAAKDQRLNASAALITQFSAYYQSAEIKASRKSLSTRLLDKKNRDSIDLTKSESVLAFFEDMAYLTRRKILDEGMVWNMFFPALERYYIALTSPPDLFVEASKGSPSLYREIRLLFDRLKEIDRKEDGKSAYEPDNDRIQISLQNESNLVVPK